MDKVRVGIVGAGGVGDSHARDYLNNPYAEVVAVAEIDEKRAKKFAEKYKISKVFKDFREMADDEDIDAASVTTPNVVHAPASIALLEGGKHVHCEKPMAINAVEGEKMVAVAERKGLVLQIGTQNRFNPGADYIRDAIEENFLGEIVMVRGAGVHGQLKPEFAQSWFVKKKMSGGGALIDVGIHIIDLVRYLLFDPKAETVYAKIGTYYHTYDVDDFALLTVQFDNGVFASIRAGWYSPLRDWSAHVIGTMGYAGLDLIKRTLNLNLKLGGEWGVFNPKIPNMDTIRLGQMKNDHFIDCIINNKPSKSSGEESLESMRIIDAAYKSSSEGNLVKVTRLKT